MNYTEKSQVDNVEDLLYFESDSTNNILSRNQHPNDLSRYQNNIMAYVSPSTKRLHDDIIRNSPSRVRHHNAESLRASRKNMISIIDYIISIGEIEEDPQSAIMFDDMEKKLFKSLNWKYNNKNYHDQKHHHVRAWLNSQHLMVQRKNQNQDWRDLKDSCYLLRNSNIQISQKYTYWYVRICLFYHTKYTNSYKRNSN